MSSFRRGLRDPNPLVLVVAGLLLVPALLGLQWIVTSGIYTRVVSESSLNRRTSDDWAHVSWQVGHLKQSPPQTPAVYLLGGSTTREMLISNASMERAIRQVTGRDVLVNDLASMNQSFGQSMAIADNLPPKDAVLLIGVNQARFTAPPIDNEDQIVGRPLLLRSADLRSFVAARYGRYKYSYTILPGIMSYIVSYLQEGSAELKSGHLPDHPFNTHRYTVVHQYGLDKKQALVKKWIKKRAPEFLKNYDYNAALMEELVRDAKARGFTVVLFNLPLNDQVVAGRFDVYTARYKTLCAELAVKYGVTYMDIMPQLGLVSGDFQDLTHVVEPGRAKLEPVLAAALGDLITGTKQGSDAR